jgi:hypothetical protein
MRQEVVPMLNQTASSVVGDGEVDAFHLDSPSRFNKKEETGHEVSDYQ